MKGMRHIVGALLAAGLLLSQGAHAEVPLVKPDRSVKTLIAPKYFGPNAFPVPEMLDGTVSPTLQAELAGDYSNGFLASGRDNFFAIHTKISIPLWTPRVNLTFWMPVCEWWNMGPEAMAARRVDPSLKGKGHDAGAAFLSIDFCVLKERKYVPAIAIRAALRTASDGSFANGVSYDSPGYFFDAAIGKNFGPVRLAVSAGFLCWQVTNGGQNDAIMFGALARYEHRWISIGAQFGGYWGWERDGDFPMTLRARIEGPKEWMFRPFALYQRGLHDWQFDQVRVGVIFSYDILKFRKQKDASGSEAPEQQ